MGIAVKVEGLSKRFMLGETFENTLSSRISDLIRGRFLRRSLPAQEFWALRDIDFEIQEGEAVGIIGGNGAGKSTLLKILSRITPPTSGRARVKGRLSSLLEVGTGFHPELTGRENIFLNGAILGMRKAEVQRKFDEIVGFAGVEKFIDTPVKRYSSGMYVRLAFAVAAHLEPDVLVIDEVLAVGDAEFQKRCLGKMDEVVREGRTILFVSHNMAAIRKLCTRGILLAEGRMKFQGDIVDALTSYFSPDERGVGESLITNSRPAWARPLIASAELVDADGNPVPERPQGHDLSFAMTFRQATESAVHRPVMGVVLKNDRGDVVGNVNTRMTKHLFPTPAPGEHRFVCTLQSPPLLQGNYSVDLWLADGDENLDVVENALHFHIADADVYGTGVSPFSRSGSIFLRAEWDLFACGRLLDAS